MTRNLCPGCGRTSGAAPRFSQAFDEDVSRGHVPAVDDQRSSRRPPRHREQIELGDIGDESPRQKAPERLLAVGGRWRGGRQVRLDAQIELVEFRDLADESRPGDVGAPEHERVDVAALGGVEARERRPQAKPDERDRPRPRARAQLVDRRADVVEPSLDETGRELVAAGVAGPEEIEAHAGEATRREALGEVAIGSIGPRQIRSDRVAKDDARVAPRSLAGWMIEAEEGVKRSTEVDRLFASEDATCIGLCRGAAHTRGLGGVFGFPTSSPSASA